MSFIHPRLNEESTSRPIMMRPYFMDENPALDTPDEIATVQNLTPYSLRLQDNAATGAVAECATAQLYLSRFNYSQSSTHPTFAVYLSNKVHGYWRAHLNWSDIPDWQRELIDDIRTAKENSVQIADGGTVIPNQIFDEAIKFIEHAKFPQAIKRKPSLVLSCEDKELALLWETDDRSRAVIIWFAGEENCFWSTIEVPPSRTAVHQQSITDQATSSMIRAILDVHAMP
jgi:hypothetical protein